MLERVISIRPPDLIALPHLGHLWFYMRAALFIEPHRVEAGDRPDASIVEPTDAIVRVVLTCVCGSDLWYYRGDSPFPPGPIGHEFLGVVEDVGADVRDGGQGEAVRVPLADGTLVEVPGSGHSEEMLASLLTLSDVMATGHHAAVS